MQRTLARAKALNGIGFMYWTDVYPGDTCPELEEALSIGREFGDPWTIATALRNLGLIENIKGNYAEARASLKESLAIWRGMGQDGKTGSAWTLIFLGDVDLNDDQRESARSLYEEAIAILREPGDVNFLAYAIRRLAQLLWREADCETATSLCKESLKLNQEVRDPRGVMACLAGLAAIAVAKGSLERAAILMAAVETQLAAMGIRLLYVDKMEYDRNIALLQARLDEKTLKKFWSDGIKMFLEEAIAFAWVEDDI
jgi:tetratricopeptide (TPR) repeat protein